MEATKTSPVGAGTAGIAAVVIVVLWITGIMQILAGVLAGTLIVLALMMTIERVPGFWAFATTGVGTIVVLFGTAWITHAVLGADTIIGMIALCWSLVFKVLLLDEKKRERKRLREESDPFGGDAEQRVYEMPPSSWNSDS